MIGPNPLAGFGTSPRASAASSSWTRIGVARSRRIRSANPMWSEWPWVSTHRPDVVERAAHGGQFAREIAPVRGRAGVDDRHLAAGLDQVRVDEARSQTPDARTDLHADRLARRRRRPRAPNRRTAATPRAPTDRTRGRSARPAPGRPPDRSTGTSPTPPKCPNVAGLFRSPIQCGVLPSCSSGPRPQSHGSNRPTPGTTPTRPGNATVVAARTVAGADQRRPEQLRRQRGEVADRPVEALRRPLLQARVVHPERRQDPLAEDRLERPARPLPDQRAEGVEPRVRVDPPRPGRREAGLALEREPRRVGEQMADGRSRRTGRLVEVEQAAVGGDQDAPARSRAWSPTPSESGGPPRRGPPGRPPDR